MELWLLLVPLLLFCFSTQIDAKDQEKGSIKSDNRQGKVLSLFNIVRFPNDICDGNGGKNGTCYTADECTSRGGSNGGSCASGYGICCTFTARCGQSISENCTFFESQGSEIGQCALEICRSSDNVCQLRLDFNMFIISGPSTMTTTAAKGLFGIVTGNILGKSLTTGSQCLTDTFSVTSPGGGGPPVICGRNNGEHMYVDSSEDCNSLVFQLGENGIGTGLAQRQWSIKITQYSCDFNNLAPDGCTQYFFGQTSDTVQTFNFQGGQHLANQDQNICVRRERGNCRICWTTMMAIDFAITLKTTKKLALRQGLTAKKVCCSYGSKGTLTTGADCVIIPGAFNTKTETKQSKVGRFCGRSIGLAGDATSAKAKTICSDRSPFNLRFLSDNFEFPMETTDLGFRLTYFQDGNC